LSTIHFIKVHLLDDKYFYKLQSVKLELDYLRRLSDDSEHGLIHSDAKRKECRILLANIFNNTKAIQAKMGTDFIPEFKDD
jgi:hypothetical protein